MLPPKYYYLHYDGVTGELLGFFNPMKGKCTEEPTILIDLEQYAEASSRTQKFRVLNGKLVQVDNEEQPVQLPEVNVANALIAGLVVGQVCYAIDPSALSVMLLDLAAGGDSIRAVVHTPDGTRLESLVRDEAVKVAASIAGHLASLHCG